MGTDDVIERAGKLALGLRQQRRRCAARPRVRNASWRRRRRSESERFQDRQGPRTRRPFQSHRKGEKPPRNCVSKQNSICAGGAQRKRSAPQTQQTTRRFPDERGYLEIEPYSLETCSAGARDYVVRAAGIPVVLCTATVAEGDKQLRMISGFDDTPECAVLPR